MTDNHTPHKSEKYNSEIKKTIPYYDLFHNETIDLIKTILPNLNHWLDTGCGTGNLIEKAIKKFPNCQFYLSDPSKQMLQICRDKFANNPVKIIGEVQTSEIEKNIKFDVITAIQCHHYLDYESRIMTTKHCYDLLNPNGIYITFENIKPDTENGIKIGLNRWSDYQRAQGKSKYEIESHIDRFDKEYFPIRISEHIEIMKQVGFSTVELFWMSNMQSGFYGIKPF